MGKVRSPALRGVAMLTATGIFSQALGFFYRIALSRLIGAEVLGLYQLIMPVYSVLLSLTSIGLTAAVSNLSARYQAVGNTRGVWELRQQALGLFFLLATPPCLLLALGSDAVSVILGDARTQLGLILLIPCFLLTGIENLQKHYFYGVGFVRPAALTELAEQVIRTGAVLGLLLAFLPQGGEKTVGLILVGMIISEIFSAILQTILFRRHLGPVGALRGSAPTAGAMRRQIGQIAMPVGITALLGNLIGAANSAIIPRLLVKSGLEVTKAMEAFGVMFGMTLPMLFLPTCFLGALNLVLLPRLAESSALGQGQSVRRRLKKAFSAANLLLIPSLALLAVVGPQLGVVLYRDDRAGDYMALLAVGVLFSCWQTLLSNALYGLDRSGAAAGVALLTDGVQLALTYCTVGRFGLEGFVWGYVFTSALGAWLCWKILSRETGLSMPVFDWFTAPVLGALLSAFCTRLLYCHLLAKGVPLLAGGLSSLLFGIILYLAALQAMGISIRGLLGEEKGLASRGKRR